MSPLALGLIIEGVVLVAVLLLLVIFTIRKRKSAPEDGLSAEASPAEDKAAAKAAAKAAKAQAKVQAKERAAEEAAARQAQEAAAAAQAEQEAAARQAQEAAAARAEAERAAASRASAEAAAHAAAAAAASDSDDDADDNPASFEDESAGDEVTETYDETTGKRYRRRYEFSFSARLIQASPELQMRYGWLKDEMAAYPALKSEVSWKHERIAAGRKTIATILFQGTQMCVAFALGADDLEEEPKFHLTDVSSVKRFKNTPLLIKLTSNAKAKYACELLALAAGVQGIARAGETVNNGVFSIPFRTTDELVSDGLVKLFTSEIV